MKRSSLAVAALAATLLVSILVMSGGAQAGAGTSSMNDIYPALRIQNLVPANGSTQFVSGDQLYFNFNLVNTSANPLVVPLKKEHGATAHLVGASRPGSRGSVRTRRSRVCPGLPGTGTCTPRAGGCGPSTTRSPTGRSQQEASLRVFRSGYDGVSARPVPLLRQL